MEYAVYIWNRTPHKAIDMLTPYQKCFNIAPDISDIHPFGQIVYVKRTVSPDKLSEQAIEGRWIGKDPDSNGYRIYWPNRKSITVERNITFSNQPIQPVEGEENLDLDLEKSITESDPSLIPIPEEITEPIEAEITTGKRTRKPSRKILEIMDGKAQAHTAKYLTASLATVTAEIEAFDPLSVAEAKRSPDWLKWEEAMKDEISRLEARGTYHAVDPPPDANILTCKWVYRTKKDEQGKITGYRARLVIRGYNQIPEVDYFPDETFASVATSIYLFYS